MPMRACRCIVDEVVGVSVVISSGSSGSSSRTLIMSSNGSRQISSTKVKVVRVVVGRCRGRASKINISLCNDNYASSDDSIAATSNGRLDQVEQQVEGLRAQLNGFRTELEAQLQVECNKRESIVETLLERIEGLAEVELVVAV